MSADVLEPQYLGNRYFRSLSDSELLAWRPGNGYIERSTNVSHANREYRRRAAVAGFDNVYDWMRARQSE